MWRKITLFSALPYIRRDPFPSHIMDCLFEGVAGLYLYVRGRVLPAVEGSDMEEACVHLETCKATLLAKERDLAAQLESLGREALSRKRVGDKVAAKRLVMDRRRISEKVQRTQSCLSVVDKQLDALQSRELDKELLKSLQLSNQAMKKIGIQGETEEAEKVMGELDDQIAHSAELTNVLATPLDSDQVDSDTLAFDLDTELQLLEVEYMSGDQTATPAVSSSMFAEPPAQKPKPVPEEPQDQLFNHPPQKEPSSSTDRSIEREAGTRLKPRRASAVQEESWGASNTIEEEDGGVFEMDAEATDESTSLLLRRDATRRKQRTDPRGRFMVPA